MRLAGMLVAWLMLVLTPAHAEPLVFHASQTGKETLDQGEGGGNPFASSLIELLSRATVGLAELPAEIQRLTAAKSDDFQAADVPTTAPLRQWHLVPAKTGEVRIALVMVVSDYARSGGASSLPGARRDAERIAAALTSAGFVTTLVVDADRMGMRRALATFSAASKTADAALIYTTGHGVEVGGRIFLVPGDYPIAERNKGLDRLALPLAEIAKAPQARSINLLFYGGCRNDPLGP